MTAETTYKSRHGYHNCDFDTWKKLKYLRKCLFEAICTRAAWNRWNAKEPQNRVRREKIRNSIGNTIGYGGNPKPWPEPKIESPFLQKNRIPILHSSKMTVELLHTKLIEVAASTRPHSTPETVPSLGMTLEQINTLYASVKGG